MSTFCDRLAEWLKLERATSPGPPIGAPEAAAVSAAQLHGTFVWLVVLAGLGGFRREFLPAVTASWAVASTQWAALAELSPLLAAGTTDQRIERS